jgi:hypothetical protein
LGTLYKEFDESSDDYSEDEESRMVEKEKLYRYCDFCDIQVSVRKETKTI